MHPDWSRVLEGVLIAAFVAFGGLLWHAMRSLLKKIDHLASKEYVQQTVEDAHSLTIAAVENILRDHLRNHHANRL